MLKYCLDRQKTQEMRGKAVDAFPPTLKFVPDWFLTRKMIKKLDDLFSNEDIIFVNEDSNFVTFVVMKWVFLVQILITLTLMMLILMKMILLFMSDLQLGIIEFKERKALKKSK